MGDAMAQASMFRRFFLQCPVQPKSRSLALCGAAVIGLFLLLPGAPAHASNDVIRAALDAQKAVQRAVEQAEREEKKRQQEAARKANQDARRAAQAERAAQQRQARAENEARKKAAREKLLLTCANIQKWIDAEAIPYYSGGRASTVAIVAVLRADRFEPFFGTRYEDMSDVELRELSASASQCLRSDGPLTSMPTRERSLVSQSLTPTQQSTHKRYLASFEARDAALQKLADEALTLEPSKAGVNRWREIATQAGAMLNEARPATRNAYQANMKKADTVAVAPALPGIVDEALATAKGLEGLRTLATLAERDVNPRLYSEGAIMDAAGIKTREECLERLRKGMDAIAAQIAATERARIDALGTGLVALEQGKIWHADYQSRVAPYANHASRLGELLSYFRGKRELALAAGEPDFQGSINQASNHEALQRLQAQYLMSEDAHSAPGTALMTAIAQRRQEIDKSLALGRPTTVPAEPAADRPAAAPSGGNAANRDTAGGEPSEEVMYDLVHSVLADATKRQNDMMAQCSRGVRSNDMMMNQVCAALMLYKGLTTGITANAAVPKILQFEKLGCAPAVGKAGYLCDYTLAVEKQLNPSIVGPEAKALLEGSTLKSARFIESRSKGWMMIYSDDAVR